jgi:hypothetical protein
MKKNVEKMENEMSNLLSDLSAITSGSSDIHKRFSERRAEITKMHKTNIMLKKVFLHQLIIKVFYLSLK